MSRLSNVPVLKVGLNERELLSVVAAYMSMRDGDVGMDWGRFIQLAGYSSVQSARICFRPVQKKLKAFIEGGAGVPDGESADSRVGSDPTALAGPAKTPKTAKQPRAPKTPQTPQTPGGKARGRPKKRGLDDAATHAVPGGGPDDAYTYANDFAGALDPRETATAAKRAKTEPLSPGTVKAEPDVDPAGEDIRAGFELDTVYVGGVDDEPAAFTTSHYEELDVVDV